jgi:hypothetical protein
MEIVFVNRFFFADESATSRIISSLAFALAEVGCTIHVVTGRRFHDGEPMPSAADEIAGVTVHRIWSSAFGCTRLIGRGLEYVTFHANTYSRIRHLAHSRRRREFGARGLELASTEFNWSRIAAHLASVYRWVSGIGPRPDCVRLA